MVNEPERDGLTDLSDRVSELYSAITSAHTAEMGFDELKHYLTNVFSREIHSKAVKYAPKELIIIKFPYNKETPYCPDETKLTRGLLISFGFENRDNTYDWYCVNLFEEVHDTFTRVWVDSFFKDNNHRFWWYSKINTKRVLFNQSLDAVPVDFDTAEFNPDGELPEDPAFLIEDRPSQRFMHNPHAYIKKN
jgi:hypothetical protein